MTRAIIALTLSGIIGATLFATASAQIMLYNARAISALESVNR